MATRTIGVISDEIFALNAKIDILKKQIEGLEDKQKPLKLELLQIAEKQGLTSGKGKHSSFSVIPNIVPQVQDWDAFWAYIHKVKYFHLVQKRPAVKACQEMWELGKVIPGVDKFMQMKVNVKGV